MAFAFEKLLVYQKAVAFADGVAAGHRPVKFKFQAVSRLPAPRPILKKRGVV